MKQNANVLVPNLYRSTISSRVSYRRGGGLEFPPLQKLNMVIIVVPSKCCLQSLSQIASEAILRGTTFKLFVWGGMGGMATDLPSSHICLCTLLSSCYHHVLPPPPPNSNRERNPGLFTVTCHIHTSDIFGGDLISQLG